MSLPDFTGVLAIKTVSVYATGGYYYRPYVSGRRLNEWDCDNRKDAESELAEELERLADLQNK